jgi:hypothetical protein
MLRKSILVCASLLVFQATAGADQHNEALPAEGQAMPAKPKPLCTRSEKLEQVAQLLADRQHIPPSSELVQTAREEGVDANPVYAKFGVTNEVASFKAWIEGLLETADAPLICGRARSGERVVLVAAVRAGAVTLVGKNRLHAEVIEEFRDPYLMVRDASGASRRIAVDGEAYGSTITLPVEWGRPLFVQLVATGPNGPRPVAERWVGKIPQREPVSGGWQSPEAWLMQLRRAADARSVRNNRLLSKEATSHAHNVCDSGKLGHELDPYGDPEARLLKRGIQARVVGEAVARARTMREALHAIEDSPSHRMTVTDPRFTDAGFGEAKDDKGRICAVVLLASWPRKTP